MSNRTTSIGITGASGFVGSNLVNQLKKDERFHIRAFSRKFPQNLFGIEQVKINDIYNNPHWNSMLTGLDCVIHSAARVHVMDYEAADMLDEYRKVNVQATLDIARAAASAGVTRFIFISSIKVNGESTDTGSAFSPDTTPAPKDPYGISKMEAELGLKELAVETGLEVIVIRPVLVYGPGVKANFLNLMKLVQKSLVLPFGAINNKRSFLSIDNLVDLIVTCIFHPKASNQTFLVSDDSDLSTTELIQLMAAALSRNTILLPIPSALLKLAARLVGKPDIGQRLCGSLQVDISKTKTLLDWTPPITTYETLEKMAKHMQGRY